MRFILICILLMLPALVFGITVSDVGWKVTNWHESNTVFTLCDVDTLPACDSYNGGAVITDGPITTVTWSKSQGLAYVRSLIETNVDLTNLSEETVSATGTYSDTELTPPIGGDEAQKMVDCHSQMSNQKAARFLAYVKAKKCGTHSTSQLMSEYNSYWTARGCGDYLYSQNTVMSSLQELKDDTATLLNKSPGSYPVSEFFADIHEILGYGVCP